MNQTEHLYNSIKSNPGCTKEDYRGFTRISEKDINKALEELTIQGKVENKKGRWSPKSIKAE